MQIGECGRQARHPTVDLQFAVLTLHCAVVNPVYEVRFYRDWVKRAGLVSFEVAHHESDLMIRARRDLRNRAAELLDRLRAELEEQIRRQPEFAESLSPLPMSPNAAPIVRAMVEASRTYDVGPMAAVAGAIAQFVGEGLLRWTPEVIVENGGDIYVRMQQPVEMGLYAGEDSPFTGELRLRVDPGGGPLGVCTSSGTIGHSLSLGRADAVVAVAESAALADAAATAIGNRIRSSQDIETTLNDEKQRGLLKGLLITMGKQIGAYGAVELVR